MWYVFITIFVYSLILTIVTIYKDSSGYYMIGLADLIVSGPVCWIVYLVLNLLRPLFKNKKPKSYKTKSEKYIKTSVYRIINNYKKHRSYQEYFDLSIRSGKFNVNDIEGWDRLIIKKSYYDWMNKRFERLMYNQKEETMSILLSYFRKFTKDEVNDNTPYDVESYLDHNYPVYVIK